MEFSRISGPALFFGFGVGDISGSLSLARILRASQLARSHGLLPVVPVPGKAITARVGLGLEQGLRVWGLDVLCEDAGFE